MRLDKSAEVVMPNGKGKNGTKRCQGYMGNLEIV